MVARTHLHRKHWINSRTLHIPSKDTQKHTLNNFLHWLMLLKLSLTCVSWSCAGRRRPPAPWTCWPAPLSPRRCTSPEVPTSAPRDGERGRLHDNQEYNLNTVSVRGDVLLLNALFSATIPPYASMFGSVLSNLSFTRTLEHIGDSPVGFGWCEMSKWLLEHGSNTLRWI